MEDVYYMPEEYTQEMLCGLETNIKPDRTDLDLLFACLTEWDFYCQSRTLRRKSVVIQCIIMTEKS